MQEKTLKPFIHGKKIWENAYEIYRPSLLQRTHSFGAIPPAVECRRVQQ